MQKIKKWHIASITIFLLLTVTLFLRARTTSICVRNESGIGVVNVELSLNGEPILDEEAIDFYLPLVRVDAETSLGKEVLGIKAGNTYHEIQFYPGLTKYLYVELKESEKEGEVEVDVWTSWRVVCLQ